MMANDVKRLFDVVGSVVGLILTGIPLIAAALVVYLQDRHCPFYSSNRVGLGGKPFRMIKLRSMRVDADASGLFSTAADDPRITKIGAFLRRYKLDELPQLWNVLRGDLSFVGPRPQVQSDVDLYTEEELTMLTVRPGITDISSIVFADEAAILEGSEDPDLRYQQVIRPWKSRLSLLYVKNRQGMLIDVTLVFLTLLSIVSRRRALRRVASLVEKLGGEDELVRVALRSQPLTSAPPPGAGQVVVSRLTT